MKSFTAQLSIEFMIVFSFILLVFIFLFALITSQRAATLSSQTYSQLQLVAQGIASQLSTASQAGNGFAVQLPLITGIATVLSYNVSITKTGIVMVSATVGRQKLQAMAYGNVQSVTSNPAFLSSGVYNLPIANGTVYIQNSFGNICVDYQCPVSTNQSYSISLSTQAVHAAYFNGQSSYVSVPSSSSLNSPSGTGAITMVAFVKLNSLNSEIFKYAQQGYYGLEVGNIESEKPAQPGNFIATFGTTASDIFDCNAPFQLKTNVWYMLAATYNGVAMVKYVNGKQYCATTSPGITIPSASTPLTFSELWAGDVEFVNASMANVQIYSSALSANQIQTLYQMGIGGPPISTSNLVGWWSLNGNFNDYSGNGNNANTFNSPVLYPAVAQISAKVTNLLGKPLSGVLVGFTTNFGNLTTIDNSGQAVTNYTNSNGIATAFLNQNGNNGYAVVKATAFNGNLTTQRNLVSWYPLNNNRGSSIFDLSGNNNKGSMYAQAYWSMPNFVASFDGSKSSYTQTFNSITMNLGTSSYTFSAWVRMNYLQANPSTASFLVIGNPYCIGFSIASISPSYFGVRSWATGSSSLVGNASFNSWHNIAVVYSGSGLANRTVYIDGENVGTDTSGSSSDCSGVVKMGYSSYGSAPFGSLANAQIYSQALTPQQVSQLYRAGISAITTNSGLIGWWPLNGDASDYSGNSNNATMYGNITFTQFSKTIAAQQTASGNVGKTLVASFNGVDYITLPTLSKLSGSSSASISAWILSTSLSSNQVILSDDWSANQVVQLYVHTNGQLEADFGSGSAWIVQAESGANSIAINNWYHVVAMWSSGSGMSVYINNLHQPLTYLTGCSLTTGVLGNPITGNVAINQNNGGGFNGLISNLQIYNSTLVPQQVQQLYEQGLTAPPVLTSSLVAWYLLNGNAKDYSLNGYNATASNVVFASVQAIKPYLFSSINNTGIASNMIGYAQVPSSGSLSPSGSLSVFATAYLNSESSALLQKQGSYGMKVGVGGAGAGKFAGYINNGPGTSCAAPFALNTNTTYQVGFTFDGANVIDYVNGKEYCSFAFPNSITVNTNPLAFGGPSDTDGYMNGALSNVEVYSSALKSTQVQELYNNLYPATASTFVGLSWYP